MLKIKKLLILFMGTYAALTATQSVVFDFGGVMIHEPKRGVIVKFLRETFGLSAEEFEKVNKEKRQAMEKGQQEIDFWTEYAKKQKVFLDKKWVNSYQNSLKETVGVNADMYALVSQIKESGVRVALLSNIDDRLAKLLEDLGLYEPFDPCLLSCKLGVEKPSSKIYELLIEKMQLPPSEILFIDDKVENVEAAKKLGIDAILFNSQTELEKELKKRGILLKK